MYRSPSANSLPLPHPSSSPVIKFPLLLMLLIILLLRINKNNSNEEENVLLCCTPHKGGNQSLDAQEVIMTPAPDEIPRRASLSCSYWVKSAIQPRATDPIQQRASLPVSQALFLGGNNTNKFYDPLEITHPNKNTAIAVSEESWIVTLNRILSGILAGR